MLAYPFSRMLVLINRSSPFADCGTVQRGHPHVRQNAFSFGEPLDVPLTMYFEIESGFAVISTALAENLAICFLIESEFQITASEY